MTMDDHEPGDCGKALQNLYLFIDRELDSASWDEIHAHLADCEPCLNEFDLESLVKEVVSRSCREKAPEPLRERVLMSIRTVQIQISREQ